MFKRKSKIPDKGKLSTAYNDASPMDAIRQKAMQFQKENPQLQGKAEFKAPEEPKKPIGNKESHAAQMRQDRVAGFKFTCN